jgi:hypothetical protein
MRELSRAQHARLDRLADQDPDAKVIGWASDGPVVLRSDGRVWKILPSGRAVAMSVRAQREVVS